MMYELPQGTGNVKRNVDPCPLSTREVEVMRLLAEGKVYKQIAHELGLSTSTVRTHLHNTYAKLGAVDRAQAVLTATERGWISAQIGVPTPWRPGTRPPKIGQDMLRYQCRHCHEVTHREEPTSHCGICFAPLSDDDLLQAAGAARPVTLTRGAPERARRRA